MNFLWEYFDNNSNEIYIFIILFATISYGSWHLIEYYSKYLDTSLRNEYKNYITTYLPDLPNYNFSFELLDTDKLLGDNAFLYLLLKIAMDQYVLDMILSNIDFETKQELTDLFITVLEKYDEEKTFNISIKPETLFRLVMRIKNLFLL